MNTKTGECTFWELLGTVPDHRKASGLRFPLRSVLGIALGAILAGRTSLAAIARWGRKLSRKHLAELGIKERRRAPCHATYHNVFKGLLIEELERVLGVWVRGLLGGDALGHIAVDGKHLRGSRLAGYAGVALLTAYCGKIRGVVQELRIPAGANEITMALHLLRQMPLKGVVVTGDAIFAQREICQEIVDGGGDYFFVVKGNQEALEDDIGRAFPDAISPLSTPSLQG